MEEGRSVWKRIILLIYEIFKADVDFWNKDLQPESIEDESYDIIDDILSEYTEGILECVLDNDSSEVAISIFGYFALLKRLMYKISYIFLKKHCHKIKIPIICLLVVCLFQ